MAVSCYQVVLVPTPKNLGNSYEIRALFELPAPRQQAGDGGEDVRTGEKEHQYDFGLQLLWSRDDSEYTRVGVRSTTRCE